MKKKINKKLHILQIKKILNRSFKQMSRKKISERKSFF